VPKTGKWPKKELKTEKGAGEKQVVNAINNQKAFLVEILMPE